MSYLTSVIGIDSTGRAIAYTAPGKADDFPAAADLVRKAKQVARRDARVVAIHATIVDSYDGLAVYKEGDAPRAYRG
jgi:hypothetical protein